MKFGMTVIAITVAGMMTAPAFLFADQDGRRAHVMKNTDTVREIQQLLNQRGFNAGDVDGQWGSQTSSALVQERDPRMR